MTKETINKFKEKIYYQYNLINSFIFDYIEDITYNIINYINLVNLKGNITLFSQNLNETMFSIYDNLSSTINNKFDVLNYENLERRRLEWIWNKGDFGEELSDNSQTWNLPFSFSINLFDYLRHCGIDFGKYNYTIPIGKDFQINLKFEIKLIFGFEFGLNFYFSKNNIQIYIDLYIELSFSASAEFGYSIDFSKLEFLKSINDLFKLNLNLTNIKENLNLCSKFKKKTTYSTEIDKYQKSPPKINFISINFSVGVSINIASIRVGLKYQYSKKEKSNQLVVYYEIKFICIKGYIYFELTFLDLFSINLEFGFELFCLYETNDNYTICKDIPNLNAQ